MSNANEIKTIEELKQAIANSTIDHMNFWVQDHPNYDVKQYDKEFNATRKQYLKMYLEELNLY